MNAIQIMMDEHIYIKKALQVIRTLCIKIVNTGEVDIDSFYQAMDFVKNYADHYHHGKEEEYLFKMMGDELGDRVQKGPISGMLAEHDLGRLYMSNLREALKEYENNNEEARVDIIGNAMAYTELLHRHITKEDTAVYAFAEKRLSEETLQRLDQLVDAFENSSEKTAVRAKYLGILDELERKYT